MGRARHYNDQLDRSEKLSHQSRDYRIENQLTHNVLGQIAEDRQRINDKENQVVWDYYTAYQYDKNSHPNRTSLEGLAPFNWEYFGRGHLVALHVHEVKVKCNTRVGTDFSFPPLTPNVHIEDY